LTKHWGLLKFVPATENKG